MNLKLLFPVVSSRIMHSLSTILLTVVLLDRELEGHYSVDCPLLSYLCVSHVPVISVV